MVAPDLLSLLNYIELCIGVIQISSMKVTTQCFYSRMQQDACKSVSPVMEWGVGWQMNESLGIMWSVFVLIWLNALLQNTYNMFSLAFLDPLYTTECMKQNLTGY